MAVKLTKNRKKSFDKAPIKGVKKEVKKAMDEVVQIKRSEWEAMQESQAKVTQFMDDLVEGNLEIEIIDDEDGNDDVEKEDVDVEADGDVEDIEVEGDIDEDPENVEDIEEIDVDEDKIDGEDEKADDEELTETLKDPAKRKAVLEFLKVTDAKKEQDSKDEEEKKKIGDKKIKRELKRKTLKKAEDAAIPDFTSRFKEDKVEDLKAVDEKNIDKRTETEKFTSRFE